MTPDGAPGRDGEPSRIDATFSACIAEILDAAPDEVPHASGDGDLVRIGWWLAARDLALVPVRDPGSFQWPGWWIGRRRGVDGHVVMAGTPSGVAWVPPGAAPGGGEIVEGWVIARPALSPRSRTGPDGAAGGAGTVASIFRFADSGAPGETLGSAELIADVGLAGDRYALGTGHFQAPGRWGQALTLIEAEAIERLSAERGIALPAADARRNLVTRGIDLNALVGRRFRVGEALCLGQRLAEPCSWLQRTTPPGTLRGLVHRGGLRADVLEGGTVRVGDRIEAEGTARGAPRPTDRLGRPIGDPVPGWSARERPARTAMEGRLVRVVPLAPATHGPSLHAALAEDDGRAWTYLPYGPFAAEADLLAWLEAVAAGDDPLFHAILERDTGRAVGLGAYLRIAPEAGTIEVGHLLFSPALQRTALATEAMALMMRRVFDELGYRRYEWKCDALNARSRRAAERLGFTCDGTFERAAVYKGRNRDTAWYSVLDRDWPVLRGAFDAWLAPANFDAEGRQRRALGAFVRDARAGGSGAA